MNWLRWRHRLEYLVFRLLICVVQMLSAARSREFAEAFAFVMHRALPRKLTRYGVARDNLRQALGPDVSDAEIDEHIRRMWVHLFRFVIEVAQLPRKLRHENLLDVIVYDGGRRASWQAFNTGRPVMLVGGHFGNWEVVNAVFGLFGTPLGVVARDLDNPYLDDWFQRFRALSGHWLISKNGASAAMPPLLERRGHLALLCDQDAGPRGVFVDFFGKPASTFKSIALLAIEYRAIIVVGGALRLPHETHHEDFVGPPWVRFQLCSEDVIDPLEFEGSNAVEEITRRYTTALERLVRRAPEQYFWVHRRWKSQPQQPRSAKNAAKAA